MTLITTVLLGAGVLFIASALDNTPLVQTFQKILSNSPINWSGSGEVASPAGTKVGGATTGSSPVDTIAQAALLGGAPPTTTPHKS